MSSPLPRFLVFITPWRPYSDLLHSWIPLRCIRATGHIGDMFIQRRWKLAGG